MLTLNVTLNGGQIEEKKDVSEGARVQNVYTNVYARNIIQIVYYLLSVGS